MVKGSSTIVSLGASNSSSARTFSATSIPSYQNLTADNFFVNSTGLYHYANLENNGPQGPGSQTLYLTKSYNASTGVLTVSQCSGIVYSTWKSAQASGYSQAYVNYTVYCAYWLNARLD